MTHSTLSALGAHAAQHEKQAVGKLLRLLNPFGKGLSKSQRLMRGLGAYTAGEGALTGGELATDFLTGSKAPRLEMRAQKLQGYDRGYKPPTNPQTSPTWTGGTSTTPGKDFTPGKGMGPKGMELPALLGGLAARPTATLATILGGYGADDTPGSFAYSGDPVESGRNISTSGPGDKTTSTTVDVTNPGLLTPKGQYKVQELEAIADLMDKREQQRQRDVKFRSDPAMAGSFATRPGENVRESLERRKQELKDMEAAGETGLFGGDYPRRYDLGPGRDQGASYDSETKTKSKSDDWGLEGKSQLDYRRQLEALLEELENNVNVQRSPEWAGRAAALREELRRVGGGVWPNTDFPAYGDFGNDESYRSRRR